MDNLLDSFNKFENDTLRVTLNNVDSFIRLYKSATLKSADIIHADLSYNKVLWFSDVAIVMDTIDATNYITDQGICFGKVSKVFNINVNLQDNTGYQILNSGNNAFHFKL